AGLAAPAEDSAHDPIETLLLATLPTPATSTRLPTLEQILAWQHTPASSPFLARLPHFSIHQTHRLEETLARFKAILPTTCPPLLDLNGAILTPKHAILMIRLYHALNTRLNQPHRHDVPFQTLLPPHQRQPHPHQTAAILHTLNSPLSIITGGPGTGKTTIVGEILKHALHPQGLALDKQHIRLAAPTGKAAQRMAQSLAQDYPDIASALDEPQTLHRLLSLQAQGATPYNEHNPIDARLIIVDEVSMIALPMALTLLHAIRSDAKIVLIGDPDQLPPVDTGNLLSNIILQHPHPCTHLPPPSHFATRLLQAKVELTHNFRIRSTTPNDTKFPSIYAIQNDVIAGRTTAIQNTPSLLPSDCRTHLRTGGFACYRQTAHTKAILDHWVDALKMQTHGASYAMPTTQDEETALKKTFDSIEAFKILTPTNDGIFGTQRLNGYLIAHLTPPQKSLLRPGVIVMLTQNNYTIGHFNGETGIIVKDNATKQRMIAFPATETKPDHRTFDYFPLDWLRDSLIPAFAITIHKSQGSEFQHVLTVLPPQTPPALLTKNLLYTALSRARHSAALIAEEETLLSCIMCTPPQDPSLVDLFHPTPIDSHD
ncbi:MAG: AAA family ATPase, partial [Proteobacteria bacterium]|nr:AAA family ATPase [Pseudomonadota bacterium]